MIDKSMVTEIEDNKTKLKMVNQQIKDTLMKLVNCESVRGHKTYRRWVQTRLMDAESELKERSWSCRGEACQCSRSVLRWACLRQFCRCRLVDGFGRRDLWRVR